MKENRDKKDSKNGIGENLAEIEKKDNSKSKIIDKNFPFNPEHFLQAVDSAATRSRRLLLILIFTSVIILMALINSLPQKYNWFSSKSLIIKDIIHFVKLPTSIVDSVNIGVPFKDYIFQNELNSKNTLTQADSTSIIELANKYKTYDILLRSAKTAPIHLLEFEDRMARYERVGIAIKYLWNNGIINEEVLQNYLSKIDEAQIEHIDLVRVPILGVSFNINYLAFYSGISLLVIYYLLYFSLKREYINIKIAFRRGWKNSLKNYHHYY